MITHPLPETELLDKIREFCRDDIRDRVLTQELIVYLGLLIRAEPGLFRGFLSVRLGHLILLLVSDLAQRQGLTQDEAYEALMHEPPSQIQAQLRLVLERYRDREKLLEHQEAIQGRQGRKLHYTVPTTVSAASVLTTPVEGSWWTWRKRVGTLSLVPDDFYVSVWHLMTRCQGLVIGERLERRNRLESRAVLSEMTPSETKFAHLIEHLLNKILAPEYRQLSIEALAALADLFKQNKTLLIDDYLVLDVIIGHAVRLAYLEHTQVSDSAYEGEKATAWASFYERPTAQTRAGLVASFRYLLETGSRQLEHP